MNLKRYDAAYLTLKTLGDVRPSPAIWNNLGVLQVRRGATPETLLAFLVDQGRFRQP